MTFKIGDVVRIREDSEHYGRGGANPRNEDGVITELQEYTSHFIRVRWSNGLTNVYRPEDLELAGLPEPDADAVESQQGVAKVVLDHLSGIDPHVVVAGGAPHDWQKGIPARDVDTFVHLPTYMDASECQEYLNTLLDTYVGQVYGEDYEDPRITAVFRLNLQGVRFDLIVIPGDPEKVMETFPSTHSQISWDGEEYTSTTEYDLYKSWDVCVISEDISEQYKKKALRKIGDSCTVTQNISEALDEIHKKIADAT